MRAVDSIAFEIRRGEIFGLLPNGSGKSTTIKMIRGCCTRLRVACRFWPAPMTSRQVHIGFLPEEVISPFLDARETLDYYGKLFAWRPAFANAGRMNSCNGWVGTGGPPSHRRILQRHDAAHRHRQALVNDPEFLILDEPTSGLDPLGTRQVKDLLLDRRLGARLSCCHRTFSQTSKTSVTAW